MDIKSTNGLTINSEDFKTWLENNSVNYQYLVEDEETLEFYHQSVNFDPSEVYQQWLDDTLDFDFRNSLETDFEAEESITE